MKHPKLIFLSVLLGGVVVIASQSLFTVYETQQVLVLQFGDPKRAISKSGLKVKLPFVQNVVRLEKRILALDTPPQELIASDQKRMVVDAFARFRISDPLMFYKSVNNLGRAESRLNSLMSSGVRRVLGKEKFLDILGSDRQTLMHKIRDSVNTEVLKLGMEIVDIRIKRVDLPLENSQAIYQRMKTDRQKEAAEARARGKEISREIRAVADRDKTVLLAEARKTSEILKGEGDKIRARLFNEAAEDYPHFFTFYRALEAYEESMKKENTTLILYPDSPLIKAIENLFKEKTNIDDSP